MNYIRGGPMNTNESKRVEPAITFNPNIIGKDFVSFNVPGEPFAKQRPRARKIHGFISIYTPNETKNYEKKVAESYRRIYKNKQLMDNLTVEIEGIFSVPKSATKKQREEMLNGNVPHVKKPDCDNMGKVCLDGLNGVAYPDDAAIDKLIIWKRYGSEAMTRITIYNTGKEIEKDE